MAEGLFSALGLGSKEHVALVGGGGKTSLLRALAQELHQRKARVVISTTTKLWQHEARCYSCNLFTAADPSWKEALMEELQSFGIVFVARQPLPSGKVEGIDTQLADTLFRDTRVDYLILEADGSAGRPLKAPAPHEPVIPTSATLVIALMGLEAVGKRLEPQRVFRADRFEKLTGLKQGAILTSEAIARAFAVRQGLFKHTPPAARRIAFLNKTDLIKEHRMAEELACMLLKGPRPAADAAVVGSLFEKAFFPLKERDCQQISW